ENLLGERLVARAKELGEPARELLIRRRHSRPPRCSLAQHTLDPAATLGRAGANKHPKTLGSFFSIGGRPRSRQANEQASPLGLPPRPHGTRSKSCAAAQSAPASAGGGGGWG